MLWGMLARVAGCSNARVAVADSDMCLSCHRLENTKIEKSSVWAIAC